MYLVAPATKKNNELNNSDDDRGLDYTTVADYYDDRRKPETQFR